MEDRTIEYVDHLHEHVVDPVVISDGRYVAPRTPGFSAALKPDSITAQTLPDGLVWMELRNR